MNSTGQDEGLWNDSTYFGGIIPLIFKLKEIFLEDLSDMLTMMAGEGNLDMTCGQYLESVVSMLKSTPTE